MPLFGKSSSQPPIQEQTTTTTTSEPRRSSTLFGRRRASSPVTDTTTSRNSRSSLHNNTRNRSRSITPPRRGLLHRHNDTAGDPSIRSAHDRVLTAEAAEREADKALLHARAMVKDARDHVKRLEREAAEDARLAKLKQKEAASISKRAGKLGGM